MEIAVMSPTRIMGGQIRKADDTRKQERWKHFSELDSNDKGNENDM